MDDAKREQWGEQPRRTWPRGRPLPQEDARDATCGGCGAPWSVHKSMCGFRLRCDCGDWVAVPRDPSESRPLLADPSAGGSSGADGSPAERANEMLPVGFAAPTRQPMRTDERGLVHVHAEAGEVVDAPMPTSLAMAPGALQSGKVEWRARWTSVALLEVVAVLAAILVPQLAAMALAEGNEGSLLLPFASLLGGLAVLAIAAFSGPYGTIGFRRFGFAHAIEAVVAPLLGFAFAVGWCEVLFAMAPSLEGDTVLRQFLDRLGPELTLFTVAVMPAVVEEIGFRGMLQGRLMALLGRGQGCFVTAVAFMLVHLSPATMPIHLGLGLYLGWLRERSGSLWPGIFVHFAYNSMVVLLFP
jgi:membrane protease YdiL (CAAX protease family)